MNNRDNNKLLQFANQGLRTNAAFFSAFNVPSLNALTLSSKTIQHSMQLVMQDRILTQLKKFALDKSTQGKPVEEKSKLCFPTENQIIELLTTHKNNKKECIEKLLQLLDQPLQAFLKKQCEELPINCVPKGILKPLLNVPELKNWCRPNLKKLFNRINKILPIAFCYSLNERCQFPQYIEVTQKLFLSLITNINIQVPVDKISDERNSLSSDFLELSTCTPLMVAANLNLISVAKELIQRGADVNAVVKTKDNKKEVNVLMVASHKKHDMLNLLLQAKPTARTIGMACEHIKDTVILELLKTSECYSSQHQSKISRNI